MVARVGGNPATKKHLANLGFVEGAVITVVADTGDGNMIVNVKESRVAIIKQMASKIMVQG